MISARDVAALNKYVFVPALVILGLTFFLRNNLRSIGNIRPAVLKEPAQTQPAGSAPFRFEKNGYDFTLTPLYDYEISGLVVSKLNYDAWYSFYKTDKTFTTDLCLIWGENVRNNIYKKPGIRFSQDQRWCWCSMDKQLGFNFQEMSNNHLVVNDKRVAAKIRAVNVGDQVRIKGQLVDIYAKLTGRPDTYDYNEIRWHTSTTRLDSGAGACEVIYVKDIDILSKGNPMAHFLNMLSFYVLCVLIALNLIQMSRPCALEEEK